MILILGATGYVGQAFVRELRTRGLSFIPLSREAFDYTRFDFLCKYIRQLKPELVINAAGCTGRPNLDGCESDRVATFAGNVLLPQKVARICQKHEVPLAHVSSGGIYTGAKLHENGELRVRENLNDPAVRRVFEQHPERFSGFTEWDPPNHSFRSPPCSFYAGTKALAEEVLRSYGQTYLWRIRMPFNEINMPCNFLSRLQSYVKVYDHVTALSHLEDFVRACLDLVDVHAEFGIYNVTNPGAVTTRQVVEMIRRIRKPERRFEFWKDDEEFYSDGRKAPRSSCLLDVSKLRRAGIRMRPVTDALEDALERWRSPREVAAPTTPARPARSTVEVLKG